MTAEPRVPVTLLSGFLGSGKTTLLNRILAERTDTRFAVVVNEFGDVGIDGRLVVGADEEVIELSNGCVCCTVRGDLAAALGGLFERRERRLGRRLAFDRVLIEASGLASPGPVAQTLEIVPELSERAFLDGIVTLARADSIRAELEAFPEAAEQVGYADRLVLNGCDLANEPELAAVEQELARRNSLAPIVRAVRAEVDVATLVDIGTRDSSSWSLERATETAHDARHGGVGTITLRSEAELDLHRLKLWLQLVAADRSHEVLRLKGVFACEGIGEAVVAQGVYQWLELGPGAPERPRESVLVLIGRGIDREQLERGWRVVTGTAS